MKTAKLLKVAKVEAGPYGPLEETVALGCEYEGSKYHIWLNPVTLDPGEKVYKNPINILGNPRTCYKTRYLRPSSGFCRLLIAAMLQAYKANNLLARFKGEAAKEEAARKARNEAADKLEKIQSAAPEMYRIISALEKWFKLDGSVSGSALVFGYGAETLEEALGAVAKKLKAVAK